MRSSFGIALAVLLAMACGPRSEPHAPLDSRTAILVDPEIQAAIRAEMRTMLGSLHEVLAAAAAGDTTALRSAATRSGLATAADPALEKILPPTFLELGMSTHRQFDELAASGADLAKVDSVAARLGRLTQGCVSCHNTYRLELR